MIDIKCIYPQGKANRILFLPMHGFRAYDFEKYDLCIRFDGVAEPFILDLTEMFEEETGALTE